MLQHHLHLNTPVTVDVIYLPTKFATLIEEPVSTDIDDKLI